MKNKDKFVPLKFQGTLCVLEYGAYANERLSLKLVEHMTGEPVAVCTINVDTRLKDDQVIIKNYSENYGMYELLKDRGIISTVRKTIPVGMNYGHICDLLVTKEMINNLDY